MRKFLPFVTLLFIVSIFYGCDKEKIVSTTETVHDIEYIELFDTVYFADTIYLTDSVESNTTDTVVLTNYDTVTVTITNTDTVQIVQTNYDTVTVTNTVIDTVQIVQNNYDTVTVTVTDTVVQNNVTPDAYYAYSALQFHTDPEVLQFINTEFGLTDGWILYLSSFQNNVTNPSVGVFDFTGVIDYWTTDWASYYPLEYLWRVTYTGGEPSDPQNWTLTDPPGAVNGNNGGVQLIKDRSNVNIK